MTATDLQLNDLLTLTIRRPPSVVRPVNEGDQQVNGLAKTRCSGRHSTCLAPVHRCALDRRSCCGRAGARLVGGPSVNLRRRCAPSATRVLLNCRPARGLNAVRERQPIKGSDPRRRHSGLRALVPKGMRRNATAAPLLHTTDGWQDKSREVRPGRMAGERRNIGALAEVHLSPQPVFLENARRINARRTSHAVAWSLSAVRACRRVAWRAFRPFGSSQVPWHTAAMACPLKSRRRASPLRGLAGGFMGRHGRTK
jgi:hypothetical protein